MSSGRTHKRRNLDSVATYAPDTNVPCPDLSTAPLIRRFSPQNQTLHPEEQRYISERANNVLPNAWKDWLGDGSGIGYDLSTFSPATYPKIGIAVPGGGLRAAQYGAGCLLGLDARNATAKAAGTGGLLQVASYLSGLSALDELSRRVLADRLLILQQLAQDRRPRFRRRQDLSGWMLDLSFVTPDGVDLLSDRNQAFYGSILYGIIAKADRGVDTSLTDPWSRMISYHFLNQTTRENFFSNDTGHGSGQLWSRIPQIPAYQSRSVPFPIVVADSRPVGSNLTATLPLNSVVYEITPLEFASFDPFLSTGMNLSYAGTHLSNGRSINGTACVTGLDQAGFVMGTSASLFNQILDFARNTLSQFSSSDSAGLLYVLSRQLQQVRTRADDVANWPNPFQGLDIPDFQDVNASWLELIDGSSNQENIPYGPLLVRARNLDVIVTAEGSADDPVNNWPNGTGLIFTSTRQTTLLQSTHQQFPPIPSTPEDFIATGVNAHPTFFGCDPSSTDNYPLIIYLPNAPPISGNDPVTNTPTFQLTYTLHHTRLFIDQVFSNTISGFTPKSNSPDPNWGKCLQCAAFDRARSKVSPAVPRSTICIQCFNQYCYNSQNPSSKSELPNRKLEFVDPDPQGLSKIQVFFSVNKFKLLGGLIGLIVLILLITAGFILFRKHSRSSKYQKITPASSTLIFEEFKDHPIAESYKMTIYSK
ncbi:unnamed protein product [Cyclocybe aegerita]|uniref:Lysophospholipase n=1 Tax=Cyclocybe aegerita TaxID=1973307 RepID=A0A8S0XQP9_CYCAE|nr:unnamed protein product [Cyclocybe aegerita]